MPDESKAPVATFLALLFLPFAAPLFGLHLSAVTWMLGSLPITGLAVVLGFSYSEEIMGPVTSRLRRRWALRTGNLHLDEGRWLIGRHQSRHRDAPTGEDFVNELLAWILVRSQPPAGTREQGRLIVDWFQRGLDLRLLRDVLAVEMSAAEIRGHLTGTAPLDPDAVATLAALRRGASPRAPQP